MARIWRRQGRDVWASQEVSYRGGLVGALDEASGALEGHEFYPNSRELAATVIAAFLRAMASRGITKYGDVAFEDLARHVEAKE